jgi:hypothetical protein
LAAGQYFVRGRAADTLLEGSVRVEANQLRMVSEAELERVQYARLARKGGDDYVLAHGPWLVARLRSGLWDDASWCPGARLGYAWDLPSLSFSVGVGGCRSEFANGVVRANADELELQFEARYVVDTPWLSLGAGVALGGSWLRQSFVTRGIAPDRNSVAGRIGPVLTGSAELFGGLYWIAAVQGDLYWFRQQHGEFTSDRSESLTAVITWGPSLGLGMYF